MDREVDRLDSEFIEETLRTPGWALIAKRIREEHARRVRLLIEGDGCGDKTRGMILALELALKVPEIIATEARGNKGNK
jgi:hypothetical protein